MTVVGPEGYPRLEIDDIRESLNCVCRLTAETSAQRHISARCLCPWIRR
jgi:hypothetical protein